jgi:hypothetical protein
MTFDLKVDSTNSSFRIVCSDCNWESISTRYMENALRYWEGHKAHD